MFTLAGVSTFAHNIDRFNNTVPAGDKLIFFIKCGFVLIACIFVGVLAMRGSEGRNRIKRNKAKNNRPIRSKTNELGSGDLAVKKQIEPWLVKHDKYDTVIPVRDIKGGDGIAMKSGHLVIPAEERNRHILVIAKTGSGKTTRAILPVLFNDVLCQERSTIVIDSKPEMWDKLVGMARKYNPKKKLLLFNPLDTSRGLSWNIIGKIHTDTDAKLIANTVISATDNPSSRSDSPFFRNNALSLLNSIMVGLLSDNNEVLSMPRVHQLVNGGMEPLCKWLEAHPDAIRNSKTFVDLARSGSQNADTIMSELGMRLAAWDLSAIRATTALNELDLESLIHEPSLLVIELRESELEMLRPMANVLV
ncbi:MAG: type IV secretory system conjugative DNA transfer family protein, partial [Proteobacteria bacterium]|nr:type IV secretory system conjugative DNA transfer family protein [Pseudomonadota bacterium]